MAKTYIQKVKEKRPIIQFTKKIRTIYINGKTIPQLLDILELMLEQNYETQRISGNNYRYSLGSFLYLIDIRYNTYYKSKLTFPEYKDQWFEPEELEKLFKNREEIKYRYCQGLGNPPKIRKHHKKNIDKQKELYLQYIKSNHKKFDSKNEFERLFAIANHKKPLYQIGLMCYCEPKKRACHRFWLREALINKYYKEHNLGQEPKLSHYPEIDNKKHY